MTKWQHGVSWEGRNISVRYFTADIYIHTQQHEGDVIELRQWIPQTEYFFPVHLSHEIKKLDSCS